MFTIQTQVSTFDGTWRGSKGMPTFGIGNCTLGDAANRVVDMFCNHAEMVAIHFTICDVEANVTVWSWSVATGLVKKG